MEATPLPFAPVGVGARAMPVLVSVFPLSLSIPLSALFPGMRGSVAS